MKQRTRKPVTRSPSGRKTRAAGSRKLAKRTTRRKATKASKAAKKTKGKRKGTKPPKSTKPRGRRKIVPRSSALRPSDRRNLERAVKELNDAQRVTSLRASDLLAVAHTLGEAAVVKKLDELVAKLVNQELLRDIAALQSAYRASEDGGLPQEFQSLHLLPKALTQWLEDAFSLSLDREAGEEFDTSADRLKRFEVNGDLPSDDNDLVRLRVEASGWKRGRTQLIAPKVTLIRMTSEPDARSVADQSA